jgi:hypothetical protein
MTSRPKPEEDRLPVAAPTPVRNPTESVRSKLERLKAGVELLATQQGSDPSAWDELYKDVPVAGLKQEIDQIEELIYQATKDELEYRFANRIGVETLSTGPVYDGAGYDPRDVYWVRVHPGGPVEKVLLPKEEFPEVYELKALSAWLREEMSRRGVGYSFSN